jgi:hypothetical protein
MFYTVFGFRKKNRVDKVIGSLDLIFTLKPAATENRPVNTPWHTTALRQNPYRTEGARGVSPKEYAHIDRRRIFGKN